MCPLNLFSSTFNAFITGYKVGKVEQAETALGMDMRLAADKGKKSKAAASDDKIVRRVLNKVFTNGTLVDETLLLDEQAGHCVSIREDDGEPDKDGSGRFGICVLDSSTSEFNMSSFDDDVCRTKMETMMRQLRPKEVIFTKVCSQIPHIRASAHDPWFRATYQLPPLVSSKPSSLLNACGRHCARARA